MGVLAAPGTASAGEGEVFSLQESMTYRVGYGPAHLADLSLDVSCRKGEEVEARLQASSRGMARRVHPFRVELGTMLRLQGGSRQALTWIEEKGELRQYRSEFTPAPQVLTRAEVRGRESTESVGLPASGHDLLSWVLHLRGYMSAEGAQRQGRRYTLWDGWKLVWLDVIPGEVVEISTSAGEFRAQSFRLRRTRLHHQGEERFQARTDTEELGTIWLEVSSRALPVAMAFRAPIGRVRIELESFERTRC